MPARLIDFAEVAPGESVGDFVMGGGYVTRILAGVVGPAGHVYAFQPQEFIAFKAQYGTAQQAVAAASDNVHSVAGPFAAPAFPVPLYTLTPVKPFTRSE